MCVSSCRSRDRSLRCWRGVICDHALMLWRVSSVYWQVPGWRACGQLHEAMRRPAKKTLSATASTATTWLSKSRTQHEPVAASLPPATYSGVKMNRIQMCCKHQPPPANTKAKNNFTTQPWEKGKRHQHKYLAQHPAAAQEAEAASA